MNEIIFETENLVKKYKKQTALNEVNIVLKRGHIYGLVGNNGAGKTTLLRIITGLSRPTSGSFSLFGASEGKELRDARRRTGALIENPTFYEDMSVQQNMVAWSMVKGKVDKQEISRLREMLGIDDAQLKTTSKSIKYCSLGQKQRFGIAAALIGNPEFLVLDEPLSGLDPSGVHDMRELLLRLNRENGTTMIVSSHMLGELYKFATDYIFLHNGNVVDQMTASYVESRIEDMRKETGEEVDLEKFFLSLIQRWERH